MAIRRRPVIVTVVTDLDRTFISPLVHFLHGLYQAKEIDFIRDPVMEHVLAPNRHYRYSSGDIYLARDILRTKLAHSRNGGSRTCVLITSRDCYPTDPEFGACRRSLHRQKQAIAEWDVFDDVRGACVTRPAIHIISV